MEFTPAPALSRGGAWSLALKGRSGHSLVAGAAISGTVRRPAADGVWRDCFSVLVPACLLLSFDKPEDPAPRSIAVLTRDSSVEVGADAPAGSSLPRHVVTIRPDPATSGAALQLACSSTHEQRDWAEAVIRHRSPDVVNFEKEALERELTTVSAERDRAVGALRAAEAKAAAAVADQARLVLVDAELTALTAGCAAAVGAMQAAAAAPPSDALATATPAAATPAGAVMAASVVESAAALATAARASAIRVGQLTSRVVDSEAALRSAGEALDSTRRELADYGADWALRDRKWATSVQLLTSRLSTEHERARALAGELLLSRRVAEQTSAALSDATRKYNSLAQEHRKCYSLRAQQQPQLTGSQQSQSRGSAATLDSTGSSTSPRGGSNGEGDGTAAVPSPPEPSTAQTVAHGAGIGVAGDSALVSPTGSSGGGGGAGANGAELPRPPLHRQRSASMQGLSSMAGAASLSPTSGSALAFSSSSTLALTATDGGLAAAASSSPRSRSATGAFHAAATPGSVVVSPPLPPAGDSAGGGGGGPSIVFVPVPPSPSSHGRQPAPPSPTLGVSSIALPPAQQQQQQLQLLTRPSSGSDAVFPGRLHVLMVAARGLPAEPFGPFGGRAAYLRLRPVWGGGGNGVDAAAGGVSSSSSSSSSAVTGRQVECYERTAPVPHPNGGGGSAPPSVPSSAPPHLLHALFNQGFTTRVSGPVVGGVLRVDLLAHRAMRADALVGSGVLDLSPLAEWPHQAHAVWMVLRPPPSHTSAGASASSLSLSLSASSSAAAAATVPLLAVNPAEVLIPVDAQGGGGASAGSAAGKRGRWASRDIPPPPVDESLVAVLVQAVFCLHPDDEPKFFFGQPQPQQALPHPQPPHPVTAATTPRASLGGISSSSGSSSSSSNGGGGSSVSRPPSPSPAAAGVGGANAAGQAGTAASGPSAAASSRSRAGSFGAGGGGGVPITIEIPTPAAAGAPAAFPSTYTLLSSTSSSSSSSMCSTSGGLGAVGGGEASPVAPTPHRKHSVVSDSDLVFSAATAASQGAADAGQQLTLLRKIDVLKHAVRDLRSANVELERRLSSSSSGGGGGPAITAPKR